MPDGGIATWVPSLSGWRGMCREPSFQKLEDHSPPEVKFGRELGDQMGPDGVIQVREMKLGMEKTGG